MPGSLQISFTVVPTSCFLMASTICVSVNLDVLIPFRIGFKVSQSYTFKSANNGEADNKTAAEQIRLIQQLDEDDRQTIFKLIDKMLTNQKFKDFFQNNIAAL
jgi:hypothetical protein